MARPAQLSPKRIWFDEDDCERMKRDEFEAMRSLLGAISYLAHADRDLQDRLGCLPGGKQRMAMLLGAARAMADDLIGTMPQNQCKQLRNTMRDFEIRMVPKMSPGSRNVILDADLAKGLINAAQEKCHGCVEDEISCRKCSLYRVLEGFLPLNDYGGMVCPYALSEWED